MVSPYVHNVPLSSKIWYETPGSSILIGRQIDESPGPDFLMNQRGLFNGKNEGTLDSIPGYYGGTASYKFVQNARALNHIRVKRYKIAKRDTIGPSLKSHLTPSQRRIDAYKHAKDTQAAMPTLKGRPRGEQLKLTEQYPDKPTTAYVKDSRGNLVLKYKPWAQALSRRQNAIVPLIAGLARRYVSSPAGNAQAREALAAGV